MDQRYIVGERRMAMSRRHYIEAGGEVIPEGCVFLAPLGEGDLKDHVSGESFVVDGQLTWNANEKAYLVTLGGADTRVAHIVVPNMGITTKMTTVYEYKEIGSSNFRPAYFGSAYSGRDVHPYSLVFIMGGARGSANQWKQFVQTWDNGAVKIWKNGVLFNSQTVNTTINNECNTGLSLGYVTVEGTHGGSYYVKNLRIYNRILSQQEINEL